MSTPTTTRRRCPRTVAPRAPRVPGARPRNQAAWNRVRPGVVNCTGQAAWDSPSALACRVMLPTAAAG